VERVHPVIVALDTDVLKALDVAKALRDEVAGFKVGWDLILEGGISIVSEISRYGSVVVDVKIADIPYISSRLIDKFIRRGACCVIVHGFLYPSNVNGKHVYVLAKMTVPTMYDYVWEKLLDEVEAVRGFVLPGNQPEAIKKAREKLGCKYRIIAPGIGAQGGRPGEAIEAGADFEIVGRYLLEDLSRVSHWDRLKPTCFTSP